MALTSLFMANSGAHLFKAEIQSNNEVFKEGVWSPSL